MRQFKKTLRKRRKELFGLGNNYIQVYNLTRAYKLTAPTTV